MAHEQEKQQLEDRVAALVQAKYGGDYQKAFQHYDSDQDGKIGKDELLTLLQGAGVGNVFTRSTWVAGVIEELDKDGDGRISWAEFASVFTEGKG
jgi:Ca2+-binding EF-hand superfamily protein